MQVPFSRSVIIPLQEWLAADGSHRMADARLVTIVEDGKAKLGVHEDADYDITALIPRVMSASNVVLWPFVQTNLQQDEQVVSRDPCESGPGTVTTITVAGAAPVEIVETTQTPLEVKLETLKKRLRMGSTRSGTRRGRCSWNPSSPNRLTSGILSTARSAHSALRRSCLRLRRGSQGFETSKRG